MHQSFTKNGNASIINLFEKMDSNVTKFRASITSSPSQNKVSDHSLCTCVRQSKERRVEREFYLQQEELVRSASGILKAEGNETMARLLIFMSEYLARIGMELSRELLCQCKAERIEQHSNLMHKISFLREENHKFFRMIEEKTEECDALTAKIEQLESHNIKQEEAHKTVKWQMPFASMLSSELTSRIISSNSSRVSQFRNSWPELGLPLGEVGHKRYFQPSPGDRCAIFDSRQALQQKNLNHPFQSTFRKTKIFDHH